MRFSNLLYHLKLHQKIAFFFTLLFFAYIVISVGVIVYIFKENIIQQKRQDLLLQAGQFHALLKEQSESFVQHIENFLANYQLESPLQKLSRNGAFYSRTGRSNTPLNKSRQATVFQHQYDFFRAMLDFFKLEQLSRFELYFLSPHNVFSDLGPQPLIQISDSRVRLNFFNIVGRIQYKSYLGPMTEINLMEPEEFLSVAKTMNFLGFDPLLANDVLSNSGLQATEMLLDGKLIIEPFQQDQIFIKQLHDGKIILHIETVLKGRIFNPETEQYGTSPLAVLVAEQTLDSKWLQAIKKKLGGNFAFLQKELLLFSNFGNHEGKISRSSEGWITLDGKEYLSEKFTESFVQHNQDEIYPMVLVNADFIAETIWEVLQAIVVIVLLLLFIIIVLSRLLIKWLVEEPISKVINGVKAIVKGDLSLRVSIETSDEIGTLADSFNHMVDAVQQAQGQQQIAFEDLQKMTHTFEKFVPQQFLDRVAKEGIESIELGSVEKDYVTILFSDIRYFTTLSEQMKPDEVFKFLNSYLSRMEPPIHEFGGFVDKFIGDAIMALFDLDNEQQEAHNAIEAALGMHKALNRYNIDRSKMGYPMVSAGIGIHSGDVMIGTIGSSERMDSTAIGDSVNLASRIEGMTKTYNTSILISDTTFCNLRHPTRYRFRLIGRVAAKGKKEPVTLFEIFNEDPPEILEKKMKTRRRFEEAIVLYELMEFGDVLKILEEHLRIFPEDIAAQVYIQRSQSKIIRGNKG